MCFRAIIVGIDKNLTFCVFHLMIYLKTMLCFVVRSLLEFEVVFGA